MQAARLNCQLVICLMCTCNSALSCFLAPNSHLSTSLEIEWRVKLQGTDLGLKQHTTITRVNNLRTIQFNSMNKWISNDNPPQVFITRFNCKLGQRMSEELGFQLFGRSFPLPVKGGLSIYHILCQCQQSVLTLHCSVDIVWRLPDDRRDSALFHKLADSPTSPLACTS